MPYPIPTLKGARVTLREVIPEDRVPCQRRAGRSGLGVRAYKKSGFVHEGVERESAFIDGRWEDDLIMSILDYESKR